VSELADRLAMVRSRIEDAAARAGRDADDVVLVGITKTWPVDVCKAALDAGLADLGENRAQEFRDKTTVLGPAARWHFVGHLQTNKVRHVVGSAVLIHSVDGFGLAEAISRRAAAADVVQDVLIEVNIAGEATKHGVAPETVIPLARDISGLPGVRVRGLMTMPPLSDDPETTRRYFKELAELGQRAADVVPGATELSMGMTRDFEVAVEEGATIVRVGEAIFGPRRA
jgi:PLP dependent protein